MANSHIKYLLLTAGLFAYTSNINLFAAEPQRIVGIGSRVYTLPTSEADALEFLYSSMPMSDYMMYTPEFHLRNIRIALRAKEELPWGKSIPETIWRHFVLPSRANNEYLDNFRTTYYDELKQRVKDKDMYHAALEVNHWLHEKASYAPSDARTSAPSATILNAKGRCGEESVLGVAAFRTVGIPARQVYTPRWAHTDDNHAWVEVWVDGKWYFLGACEPEAELNRAWFNAPASRGMLMHTRVFGDYNGPEQIISQSKGITEINVTDNYVPVRESKVTVVNRYGKPLPGIKVDFKIYNYAEFFTAASRTTNSEGATMLKTGKGDMLAWASDGEYFGFAKVDGENTKIILNHPIGQEFDMDIDIIPPTENPIPSHATKEDIELNAQRFDYENNLRSAYTDTFFGERHCPLPQAEVNVSFGEYAERIVKILRKAKGNWNVIYDFLKYVPETRMHEAVCMLETISEKDLRDTPARILYATLENTTPDLENPLYVEYVLNPRISNELLSDYRQSMHAASNENKKLNIAEIIKLAQDIEIDDTANAYRVPITPTQVWKNRRADSHSRDIYFVAQCRNNSIPARINPVTGSCEYNQNNTWITVNFNKNSKSSEGTQIPTGSLSATYLPEGYLSDPEYYRHFTISNMSTGTPHLYEFGDDMGERFSTTLEKGVEIPAGYYLITTGVRQASGAVNAHLNFFNVSPNVTKTTNLTMRHEAEAIEVIGNIDAEEMYLPAGLSQMQSILSTTGRGYFILGILGDTDEPSNHATTELASIKSLLTDWNRPIILLGKKRAELAENKLITWGTDPEGKVRKMLESIVPTTDDNRRLPIIVIADSFGRVVFISQGYDTSLAQKLSSVLPEL